MGLELDEPKLGAFAGSLNALDFPVQLLVRQHPPVLQGLRSNLAEAQPDDLPQQTRDAAESLGRLLTGLETREGILDRRFYAVCEHSKGRRASWPAGPRRVGRVRPEGRTATVAAPGLGPGRLADGPGRGRQVGGGDQPPGHPRGRPPDPLPAPGQVAPVSLAPGFLQGLMAAGAPMDLSVHLGAIPSEQAARTLEWQKVRFFCRPSLYP